MGPVGCDPGADPNPADGFTMTVIEVGGILAQARTLLEQVGLATLAAARISLP